MKTNNPLISFSIYCIHYSKLKDRLSGIVKIMHDLGISNFEDLIILESMVNRELINNRLKVTHQYSNEIVSHQLPLIAQSVALNLDHSFATTLVNFRNMEASSILNILQFINMDSPSASTLEHCYQHYKAISKFLCTENDICLIIEDDALLNVTTEKLNTILECCHNISCEVDRGCFFDLSEGCNLVPTEVEREYSSHFQYFDRLHLQRTRTSVAYVLDRTAAAKMSKLIGHCYMAIDWHTTYCLIQEDIDCFWARSPLFLEGSSLGNVKSNAIYRIQGNSIF